MCTPDFQWHLFFTHKLINKLTVSYVVTCSALGRVGGQEVQVLRWAQANKLPDSMDPGEPITNN